MMYCTALPAQNSAVTSVNWDEAFEDSRQLLQADYDSNEEQDQRIYFNKLTSSHNEILSYWLAAIEYEIRMGNPNIALGLTYKALKYHPVQTQLIQLSKRLALQLHQGKSIQPDKLWISEISTDIASEIRVHTIAESRIFSDVYAPQFQNTLGVEYRYPKGTLHLRANYAYRFEEDALQLESDWYPKFSDKAYAYLNYGFSGGNLFPAHRAGFEYFTNLPRSWEASLGARYLSFDQNQVTILTSSAGYYFGNYYSSLRTFIVPKKQGKPGFSAAFRTRRYLATAFQYLEAELGAGYDTNFQQQFLNGELASQTQLFIQQQFLSLGYHHWKPASKNGYRLGIRTDRLELPFDPGNYTWSASLSFQYQWGF